MRRPKATIEQCLIDAGDHLPHGNSAFVETTMQAIRKKQVSETFASVLRRTNATKKERFIMKLKHLPKAAIMGLAVAGVLVVSGSAFAAYQLWLSPSASLEGAKQNQYGRTEALVKLQHCAQLSISRDISAEIKPHSGLSPEDAAKVLQAYCEINAMQNWAITGLQVHPSAVMFPYTIDQMSGAALKVSAGNDARNLPLSRSTRYIVGGGYADRGQFHPGDSIAYVANGASATLAVIKLSLPATYYTNEKQNAIATREACPGNPQDSCLAAGGITIFPRNTEGMANTQASGKHLQIQGKLVGHTGATFTLKSSSGASYTIAASSDAIQEFNTRYAQNYSGTTVELGDTLNVMYAQPSGADPHKVTADQINSIDLLAEVSKTGLINKY